MNKKYLVTIEVNNNFTYEVEAANEEEAEKLAEQLFLKDDRPRHSEQWFVDQVTEVVVE